MLVFIQQSEINATGKIHHIQCLFQERLQDNSKIPWLMQQSGYLFIMHLEEYSKTESREALKPPFIHVETFS